MHCSGKYLSLGPLHFWSCTSTNKGNKIITLVPQRHFHDLHPDNLLYKELVIFNWNEKSDLPASSTEVFLAIVSTRFSAVHLYVVASCLPMFFICSVPSTAILYFVSFRRGLRLLPANHLITGSGLPVAWQGMLTWPPFAAIIRLGGEGWNWGRCPTVKRTGQ